MKNKRFLLTIFMMAIVGWQSAFALDWTEGGLVYTTKGDANEVSVRAQSGYTFTGTINIPSTIPNAGIQFTVVEIESGAFANSNLTNVNVNIPATVATIGQYAFINGEINTLTINRNSSSTLTIGKDAFANTNVHRVVWGGTLAQWCAVNFFNLNSNPITVKKVMSGSYVNDANTIWPTFSLTYSNRIPYTDASNAIGTNQNSYQNIIDNAIPVMNTAGNKMIDRQSTILVLPSNITAISQFAFANHSFQRIKVLGNTIPTVGADNFSTNTTLTALTQVDVPCGKVEDYKQANVWKNFKQGSTYHINAYFDYIPQNFVTNGTNLVSLNNDSAQFEGYTSQGYHYTVLYTKPTCENPQWTLTVTPDPGHKLNRWSGGSFNANTNATISGTTSQSMPTGLFIDQENYIVTVQVASECADMGTTSPSLTVTYGQLPYNQQLTATAFDGYRFVRWSNGYSCNPYLPTIVSDTVLTAYFEPIQTYSGNTVYTTDFTNDYDNHLWRTNNEYTDSNLLAIENGALTVKNLTSEEGYGTYAAAYRKVKLAANRTYTLQLNSDVDLSDMENTTLTILLSKPSNYSNDYYYNTEDNANVESVINWKNITPDNLDEDGNLIVKDFAQITNAGDYYLIIELISNGDALSDLGESLALINSLTLSERKYEVKTVMVPATADGEITSGAGEYFKGAYASLAASNTSSNNNKGYRFLGWSTTENGSPFTTSASTSRTVNADITYYAKYEAKSVTVKYTAAKGTVYQNGQNETSNNQLLSKEDNNFQNEAFGDLDYENIQYANGLYYAYNGNHLTLNTSTYTFTGTHDSTIAVAVCPVDGYKFTGWEDDNNNMDNPRIITLDRRGTSNSLMTTLKPTFAVKDDYTVTTSVINDDYQCVDNTIGSVNLSETESGTYQYMQEVTLSAVPANENYYEFVNWEDGNGNTYTENPLTITIQGENGLQNEAGRQFNAHFIIKGYDITVKPSSLEHGNVEISQNGVQMGTWVEGEGRVAVVKYRQTATINAVPFSGYRFAGWVKEGTTDTITYKQYTFSPTQDETFTAVFKVDSTMPSYIYRDTIYEHTTVQVVRYDSIPVEIHVPVTVYDTTKVPVTVNVYDTIFNVTNVDVTDTTIIPVYQTQTVITYDTVIETRVVTRDSIIVNEVVVNNPVYRDTVIYVTSYQPQYVDTIIYNYINQPVYHYVDTTIYNPVYIDVPYYDTVIVNIDTVYTICTTDTIINTVVDTVINNVHDTTIVYSYDTIYLPVYDTVYIHDTVYVGINDAAQNDNINVYQSGNQIVVNGTEGNVVRLFDAVGRMLATKQDPYGEVYFEAPATGTYLVKVGNYQAKRIVVVL